MNADTVAESSEIEFGNKIQKVLDRISLMSNRASKRASMADGRKRVRKDDADSETKTRRAGPTRQRVRAGARARVGLRAEKG